jgi:glycosyltransferase involved in cell wall biosynthesis
VPPGLLCPSIVTIHDLALLRFPHQVSKRRYLYLSRKLRSSAKRARRIIAVSESTKNDIVELLDVDPARITVTPLGVDERFHRLDESSINAFRKQVGMERPFVLFVGTLEPRKNLPALLSAFESIADDVPHDLVLIGPEGWLTDEIHEMANFLQRSGRLQLRGFVPDGQLPAWYSACDLFAFPSLYEGFGLPALEAMACGAPVVTSGTSSLPELVGDGAVMIDPTSAEAIAGGLRRVLTTPALSADLSHRGQERAKSFTWRCTAELTVEAYREAVRG